MNTKLNEPDHCVCPGGQSIGSHGLAFPWMNEHIQKIFLHDPAMQRFHFSLIYIIDQTILTMKLTHTAIFGRGHWLVLLNKFQQLKQLNSTVYRLSHIQLTFIMVELQ